MSESQNPRGRILPDPWAGALAAFADDNPPMPTPADPTLSTAKYPVTAHERPADVRALLTRKETAYPNWYYNVGERHLFYVDGIISFMKMVKSGNILFLKNDPEKKFLEVAKTSILRDTKWAAQSQTLKWDEDVAANQLRRVQKLKPVSFAKAAHIIVACELALEHKNISTQWWVYDYMRIIPAVYSMEGITEGLIIALLKRPNARANLRDIAGDSYEAVLEDLAKGHCVTAITAHKLNKYIKSFEDFSVGDVRFQPSKKICATKTASDNEYVNIS